MKFKVKWWWDHCSVRGGCLSATEGCTADKKQFSFTRVFAQKKHIPEAVGISFALLPVHLQLLSRADLCRSYPISPLPLPPPPPPPPPYRHPTACLAACLPARKPSKPPARLPACTRTNLTRNLVLTLMSFWYLVTVIDTFSPARPLPSFAFFPSSRIKTKIFSLKKKW